jgi:hypothetical protein
MQFYGGDSGYACRPYLLTPFRQPRLQMEQRFNRSHISTRATIARTFGIWKQRFHLAHNPCSRSVDVSLLQMS